MYVKNPLPNEVHLKGEDQYRLVQAVAGDNITYMTTSGRCKTVNTERWMVWAKGHPNARLCNQYMIPPQLKKHVLKD